MIPKPLGVRLLVKILEEESTIWTPSTSVRTLRGAVVEVGEDVQYVQVADEVLFMPDKAWDFRYQDENLYVLPESSVLLLLDRVDSHVR